MNQVTAGACRIASFRWAGATFWAECRKLANFPMYGKYEFQCYILVQNREGW
jgi:hypothetical protein